MDNQNLPEWYESSQSSQLSMTVKMLAAELLPVLKDLFHIQIGEPIVDRVINAVLIVGFGIGALVGYMRSKKVLGARINALRSQVGRLGQQPEA